MAKKSSAVLLPNLGLYLNVPAIAVPDRGLQDCLNVRFSEGKITNTQMGWERLSKMWQLNGPVTLIDNFFDSAGAQTMLLASTTDLYEWNEANDQIFYLTPRYDTGTVTCSGTDHVILVGGAWDTTGVKIGDFIHFGAAGQRNPSDAEQPSGPSAEWFVIKQFLSSTELLLTTNGPTVTNVPYTIRITQTGTTSDVWSTETYHYALPGPTDWWVGTNGVDKVLRWTSGATQAEYVDLGFKCKALLRWNNMMIYANLDVQGSSRRTSIRNSDIGSPFEVVDGVASELIAYDGVEEISAILRIADNLVLYSKRNVVLVAFVGLPQMFAFRSVVTNMGPVSGAAIADFGNTHEFLGADAAYSFDGVTVKETNSHVMREVVRTMPVERYGQVLAHFAEDTGELWWVVPQTADISQTSPSIAFSEHYLEQVGTAPRPFTKRELPATAVGAFDSEHTLTWDQIH